MTGVPATGRLAWHAPLVVVLAVVVVVAEAGRWSLILRAGLLTPADVGSSVASLVLVVLGGLVVLRGLGRGYGWLMAAMAAVVSTQGLAGWYTGLAWIAEPDREWPLATFAAWYQDWWMVPWLLGFLLLPALFPDGRAASPRWGRAVRATTVVWGLVILAFMTQVRELSNFFEDNPAVPDPPLNPTGLWEVDSADPGSVLGLPWLLVTMASVVIGLGSLATRWRRAGATDRRQLGLVAAPLCLMLVVVGLQMVNTSLQEAAGVETGATVLLEVTFGAALVAWSVALGVAVLRFRLYDVDLVVNRTLVYGALTAGLVATYTGVVVAAGSLLPRDGDRVAALMAAGLVALAFDPVRRRVQAGVNRLMFGQRDEPYAVLSRLGDAISEAGTPGETLQRVADGVADSLKLPRVAVELDLRGGRLVVAEHGSPDGPSDESDWRGRTARGSVEVPLVHADQEIGRLLVAPRSAREPLAEADLRLLSDVAHQAGPVAAAVRLTEDLQHSREALVLAREEERRRVRRDLHDGLGPSLAAQTLALDAAAERVRDDPVEAREMLHALKRETQQLVAEIRRLVHELRPPALDELGLAGALVAHVAQVDATGSLEVRIRTDPDPLPELSAAVEVAAYRIACEAVTNALRHAGARRCTVELSGADAQLEVRVTDDGIGLPVVPRTGLGMASMRERCEELGGTFTAVDAVGGGAEVVARLPLVDAPLADVPSGPAAAEVVTGVRRG